MQTKTKLGYHLTPLRMATIEKCIEISQKLKVELPYDPAISLLGIYPKGMGSVHQRDLSTTHVVCLLPCLFFTVLGLNPGLCTC
jgi:hypothetical protein